MVNNFPKSQFGHAFDDYFWQRGQLQIENPSSYSSSSIGYPRERKRHILIEEQHGAPYPHLGAGAIVGLRARAPPIH